MTINDERPLNVWKFEDLAPGDVFEFKEIIYIKAVSGEYNKYYNAFSLTQNILNHIDDGFLVVKLDCELNIKG